MGQGQNANGGSGSDNGGPGKNLGIAIVTTLGLVLVAVLTNLDKVNAFLHSTPPAAATGSTGSVIPSVSVGPSGPVGPTSSTGRGGHGRPTGPLGQTGSQAFTGSVVIAATGPLPPPPPPPPSASPQLVLQWIKQTHNGKPGSSSWRFDISVNGKFVYEIPIHDYDGSVKGPIPVGPPPTQIVWVPQSLANSGPYVVTVEGHQVGSGELVAQGPPGMLAGPGSTADISVKTPGGHSWGGEFDLGFTIAPGK